MAASDNEGLEVSIEISHQRMLQRVAQIEARLLKLADRADDAFKKTNNSAVKGFERTARASKQMTGNLRGMSQQLSQVVQQAQAGTNVFSALAMQLPDMVVGLGPVAILLGAVAGGLATIAINALSAKDGTDQFKEASQKLENILSDLEGSLKDARLSTDELIAKYGEAAMQIRELIGAEAELRASRARSELDKALPGAAEAFEQFSAADRVLEKLAENFETMSDSAKDLQQGLVERLANDMAKALGISVKEALALSDAFNDVSSAEGFDQQEAALRKTLATVKEMQIPLDKLPDPIKDALLRMIEMTKATRAAEKAASDLASTAATIPNNIPFGGAGSDSGLPLYMWGMSGDELLPPESKKPKTRTGGRGRKQTTPEEFGQTAEKTATDMQREIELIGETQAKIAELTTKWRLLDEAKRKGVDLNAKISSTGKTVAETIDEQAAKVGELTTKYEQASEKQRFFDDMQQTLNDGIIDSIMNAKDFGDVLDDLAKKLAAAALEAALFGSGPLGGMGIFGGGLFPTAAGGNTARAGQAMMINENTPHSEVFVPSGNGGVLNVNQAQAALKQAAKGSGGGTASVELVVRQEPGVVVEIARQQAATVVTEYDATLPSRVNKINGDPRAI